MNRWTDTERSIVKQLSKDHGVNYFSLLREVVGLLAMEPDGTVRIREPRRAVRLLEWAYEENRKASAQ